MPLPCKTSLKYKAQIKLLCGIQSKFYLLCFCIGSRKIVVSELEDLRKEILLVEARLKIAHQTKVRLLIDIYC